MFCININLCSFAPGEMAERFNAAVLKTVVGNSTGGSNPSLSATRKIVLRKQDFFCLLKLNYTYLAPNYI